MDIHMKIEERIIQEIQKKIRGKIFIDIGAFIGEYSINLAGNFKEVWAYEPAEDSCRKLRANIEKFKIENISVYQKAVGSETGHKELFRNKRHHLKSIKKPVFGGLTGFDKKNLEGKTVSLKEVQVTTLKEIIGKETIELIKIDTEGHEGEILKGGKDVIHQINNLIIELHDHHGDVHSFINHNGFKIKKKWGTKRIWFGREKG